MPIELAPPHRALLPVCALVMLGPGQLAAETKPLLTLGMLAHGRYQVEPDSDPDNQFALTQARLRANATPTEYLRAFMQVNFATANPLLDVYTELHLAPWLSLRAGQFKKPFGHVRLLSASAVETINRGLLDSHLLSELEYGNRDIGAMLLGTLPAELSYQLGVFNGSGRSPERAPGKTSAARLGWQPLPSLSTSINASARVGRTDEVSRAQHTSLAAGFDAQLRHPYLHASLELIWAQDWRSMQDMAGAHLLLELPLRLSDHLLLRPLLRAELIDAGLDSGDNHSLGLLLGCNLHSGEHLRFMLQLERIMPARAADLPASTTFVLALAFDASALASIKH